MEETNGKVKRKRGPRRDHVSAMKELAMYCRLKIEVLDTLDPAQSNGMSGIAGQRMAYDEILKRIEK